MSVTGISSNALFNYANQGLQNGTQQPQQAFLQLGQDLQSGDLSAAQSDLATLEQLMPQFTSTDSLLSNSPITQAFNQMSQDLQAGDLSAAQQEYAVLQVNIQGPTAQPLQPLTHHFRTASASETPQPTGLGYLTPQQTTGVIQAEMQQLHPNPGTVGLGLLTPLQTYTLIQQLSQQFHADAQAYMDQNSGPAGSGSLSVLG